MKEGDGALITSLLFEDFNKGCPCRKHKFKYCSLHCLDMLMRPDIGQTVISSNVKSNFMYGLSALKLFSHPRHPPRPV